jgi:hypothetical protein
LILVISTEAAPIAAKTFRIMSLDVVDVMRCNDSASLLPPSSLTRPPSCLVSFLVQATAKGIKCALGGGAPKIKEAIESIAVLRGIGPATASAVLAPICPSRFPFMRSAPFSCKSPHSFLPSLLPSLTVQGATRDVIASRTLRAISPRLSKSSAFAVPLVPDVRRVSPLTSVTRRSRGVASPASTRFQPTSSLQRGSRTGPLLSEVAGPQSRLAGPCGLLRCTVLMLSKSRPPVAVAVV